VSIFKGDHCDSEYYTVVTKNKERLSVSKRAGQKFDMEKFNFKKLNDVEVK